MTDVIVGAKDNPSQSRSYYDYSTGAYRRLISRRGFELEVGSATQFRGRDSRLMSYCEW